MFYSHLSFCPWRDHVRPPTALLASGWYASYCNAVLFKLGLNHEMYSWVVHFLNYFISISERDVGTERQEAERVGKLKFFFCKYLYIVFIIFVFCKYLYIVFIIIIKCKVLFSSHSSSSHYSMQGFIFIPFHFFCFFCK